MLAHLNVAVLIAWLLAELVPFVADRLATLECRARSNRNTRTDN